MASLSSAVEVARLVVSQGGGSAHDKRGADLSLKARFDFDLAHTAGDVEGMRKAIAMGTEAQTEFLRGHDNPASSEHSIWKASAVRTYNAFIRNRSRPKN